MSQREFGGNVVEDLALDTPGKHVLGSGPYEYFFYRSGTTEEVSFGALGSCSVYCLAAGPGTIIEATGVAGALGEGDCLQAEGHEVRLKIRGGPAQFLVAGTSMPHPAVRGLTLTRHADLYRVSKPWGHEIWINGQHPCYALKQIFVKAGTKTSLQYHHFKQETNALFQGTARLHYRANRAAPIDAVTASDLGVVEVAPISTISVVPPTLHRLEAVTDILLYETSTPHLDDVVRVQDDTRRPDGRVDTEHRR